MRYRFPVFSLALAFWMTPQLPAATLAGSDLLNGTVAETLKSAVGDKVPGGLQLKFDGSLMSEKQLRAGTADAALLILPDKKSVPEIAAGEWEAVPLAYQTVVIAVNRQNKLEQIDVLTLAGIYGRQQELDIKHWKEVPGSGLEQTIAFTSTRYDRGVVSPLFRNVVLRNGDYKIGVNFLPSDTAAEEYVLASTNAISLLAIPPEGDRVKILPVVGPGRGTAYLPNPSNLYNGDYPLAIPLYFVFAKKNQQTVRPLLAPVFGDAVADSLKVNGLVPVPKNIRANVIQRLDTAP